MTLRPMTLDDLDQVLALEQESFSVPWSPDAFREVVESSFHQFIVAEEEGRIIGFAGMSCVMDEADVENIAVSGAWQRKGVGRKLLKSLEEMALKQEMTVMFLEVRASNEPAIRLYESEGFRPVGRRKDYYEAPREDALLYALVLEKGVI